MNKKGLLGRKRKKKNSYQKKKGTNLQAWKIKSHKKILYNKKNC